MSVRGGPNGASHAQGSRSGRGGLTAVWHDAVRGSPDGVVACLLLLGSLVVLFVRLGAGPFSNWDEAVYAQIAHEMIIRGDFITPTWQYVPFFQNLPSAPPLYIWEMAVPFALFGESEFWARVPSAIAGASLVAITYLLARQAWDRPRSVVSASILLASGAFLWYARYATLDITLTALFFLGVLGLTRVTVDKRWWYLVGVSFGLGFMAKHVGIVVLAGLALLALVRDSEFRRAMRSREFAIAVSLGLAVASPWYVVMYAIHGDRFLQASVGVNIVARISQPLNGNSGGPFFYAAELFRRFFPWSVFVVPALFAVPRSGPGGNIKRVMLAVLVGVFVIYTAIPSKLAWYIVPLYPAAAILVGGFLTDGRLRRFVSGVVARIPLLGPPMSNVAMAFVVIALFIVSFIALPPARVFERDQEVRPYVDLAREIHRAPGQPLDPVLVLDADIVPSVVYYADRPAVVANDSTSIMATVRAHGPIPAILPVDGLSVVQSCCAIDVRSEDRGWLLGVVSVRP